MESKYYKIQKKYNYMKKIKLVLFMCAALFVIFSCNENDLETPLEEKTTIITEFDDSFVVVDQNHLRFIDLDKDGSNDIVIRLRLSTEDITTFYYYVAEPLREDVQIVNSGVLDGYAYSRNSSIFDIATNDIQRRWTSSLGILLEKKVADNNIQRIGMFNGSQPLYLAIRIKKNQEFHYGWIEIEHNIILNLDKILITRAGLNKTPSVAIKAGI